ncbi:MAG TPA: M3 family oligoendopeptidase [Chloroflexi bacterium]|nr:M3 family oligoendopeptidase [Chloroflexota bacterium]
MLLTLPKDPKVFLNWTWDDYQPFADRLLSRQLDAGNVDEWVNEWSDMAAAVEETYDRHYVATTVNTADKAAEQAFNNFLENLYPRWQETEQALREKLLQSGLEPANFSVPMRNFRAEADLFRAENLPLLTELEKLCSEYDRIVGAQTVEWQGVEATLTQLEPILQQQDRELRERVWRLMAERRLQDRPALNDLWVRLFEVRRQVAANAGRPDYRAYRWQQMLRFDYTPEDALRFHKAIEETVVPAATRIYARRKGRLGVESLRPWDLDVDPLGAEPLRPFRDVDELIPRAARIFHAVDPQLGAYFEIMIRENLLDLGNRKNKAPGGYCTDFNVVRRPFIFANAVGVNDDVYTLLHEGGHAFHVFESAHLRRAQDLIVPNEFAEVASMSMEHLGSNFLAAGEDPFYTPSEAARARIALVEGAVLFWPYMAVVDAFQHWAYTHPQQATDPAALDAAWGELWQRFMPGVDYSGLEDVMVTGWQRKPHIFTDPFYYIEYGLAQLGAVQVWRNWERDPQEAVRAYRRALSLGGTVTLPELYRAAGARLAFDAETLGEAVAFMEQAIERLEAERGA